MSTKLLTFIYFSPPCFISFFPMRRTFFRFLWRFTIFFSIFVELFFFTTRNIEHANTALCHAYFTRVTFYPTKRIHSESKRGGREKEHSKNTTIHRQNAKIKSIKQILAAHIMAVRECVCLCVTVL